MKKLALGLVVAAVGLFGTQARSGDAKKLTSKELIGVYKITAGEHGGKEIPQKELQADRITFTEDAVTAVDKDTKKVYAATYKLEGGSAGTRIHMVSLEPKKGQAADGLIQREGDTVTLIYALPGGKAPTEFKTQEKQMMFRMQKVKGSSRTADQ